jgi:hypothetical protein
MCVCVGGVSVRACVSVGGCRCVRVDGGARARACACARVALLIQYATRGLHIFCGPSGSTIFFDIIS